MTPYSNRRKSKSPLHRLTLHNNQTSSNNPICSLTNYQMDGNTDRASRPSRRRHFARRLENLFESTWVDPRQPIDNDSPLPRGWECRSRRNLWWFSLSKHAMTITYEDPRQHSSPAEQLRRGSISSDPTATSIARDGAQGTQYERPPAYQLRPNHQPPTADYPLLFDSIEGLSTLLSALDPRLDHPLATSAAMLQLAASGNYPTEAMSEVDRHPAQPQTPSIGDSPIEKTLMGEVQDTEATMSTIQTKTSVLRSLKSKRMAFNVGHRPTQANENQRSPGSELEPKNGSNANNESLATSPKDKDSSPLPPDPHQEQFQTLEPIKMSLRSQVSSRPESNVRV